MAEQGGDYTGTDFYCDVALKGLVALHKEYESDAVLAYHHTRPFCPVHIVVIPKQHIASFVTLSDEDTPILLEMIAVMNRLAAKVTAEHGAARLLTNHGRYQDSKHLPFHLHRGHPLP